MLTTSKHRLPSGVYRLQVMNVLKLRNVKLSVIFISIGRGKQVTITYLYNLKISAYRASLPLIFSLGHVLTGCKYSLAHIILTSKTSTFASSHWIIRLKCDCARCFAWNSESCIISYQPLPGFCTGLLSTTMYVFVALFTQYLYNI